MRVSFAREGTLPSKEKGRDTQLPSRVFSFEGCVLCAFCSVPSLGKEPSKEKGSTQKPTLFLSEKAPLTGRVLRRRDTKQGILAALKAREGGHYQENFNRKDKSFAYKIKDP